MRRLLTSLAVLLTLLGGSIATVAAQQATPTAGGGGPRVGDTVPVIGSDGQEEVQITVDEIADPFADYDPNGAPQRGFHFVMASVTVAATGPRDLSVSTSGFTLVDTDGFIYSPLYVPRPAEAVEAAPDFAGGTVAAGEEMSGPLFFQVLEGIEPALVLYRPDGQRLVTVADLRDQAVAQGETVEYLNTEGAPAASITVTDVMYPFEAYDPGSPPQRGFELVGAVITFENTGANPIEVNPSAFAVVDTEGFVAANAGIYRPEELTTQLPDLVYNSELPAGESASGLVTFQVLAGSDIAFIQFTPQGDRYLRVAEYAGGVVPASTTPNNVPADDTPVAEETPEAEETPSVDLGDIDCDAVIAWNEATLANLDTLSSVSETLNSVFSGGDVDVPAVRTAADALRTVAEDQEDIDVPDVARPINDAYVEVFDQAATALDSLADASEADDPAMVLVATANLGEIFGNLETEDLTALADGLNSACPGLDGL